MRDDIWIERAAMLEPFDGKGVTFSEVARHTGLNVSTVRTYAAKFGFDFTRHRDTAAKANRYEQRRADIRELAARGLTRQEVADRLCTKYEQKLSEIARNFISMHPTIAEEISRQFAEKHGTIPHKVTEVAMTKRQKDVFDFICQYYQENEGVSPSFDEIKDGVGLASKSGIHRIIKALEERGMIQRLECRARSIAPRYAA